MNFLTWNLLTESTTDSTSNIGMWVILIVMVVAIVVMMVFSNRSNKKRQQEQEAVMNAIRPGNKVKTIGGICGIVVEVNEEENTFVLETGNELNGKCYLKFDKQAIYQTDAKVETEEKGDKKKDKEEASEETPAIESSEETKMEESPEEKTDEKAEE